MKAKIKIKQVSGEPSWRFNVVVEDNSGQTQYSVSMSKDFYKSLDTNVEAKNVIEASFRFLLEREPKGSILSKFDITAISYYFPEFKKQLIKQLKNKKSEAEK